MKLLKGLDRCKYISKVIDNINYLVWVKDHDNHLLFANEAAFKFFKKMSHEKEIIKCPLDINGFEERKNMKIIIDKQDIWLQISSMLVNIEDDENKIFKGILIFAYDITIRKQKEDEVSRILDKKIDVWKEEKRKRSLQLDENNKEMMRMFNLSDLTGVTL
jgi:PAS domain-containing protein